MPVSLHPGADTTTDAISACFHCGIPVLPGTGYCVKIESRQEPVCCLGCKAVVETIVGDGLTDYYRHRDEHGTRVDDSLEGEDFLSYDLPAVQASFVRALDAERREAVLMLEGLRCGACVWLIERHLGRLPGVESVSINFATQRAHIRWNGTETTLSSILRAVASIGYRAYPFDEARRAGTLRKEHKVALRRLFVAGIGMMQVMMYAVPVYLANGDMTTDIEQLMRWASLLLTTPVVLYSALPFFLGAAADWKARRLGMDVPVTLGVGAAFIASVWATWVNSGEVYFDSITMFVFLLLCSRFLEGETRSRARYALERLGRPAPASCHRLADKDDWSSGQRVASASLRAGDYVLVRPGETIPADGVLIGGATEVDESLLTGESRPVSKRCDETVIAGSLNILCPVVLSVQRVGQDTALAGVLRLVDRASTEKPQIAQLADRVASWFVAGLVALTVIIVFAWLWIAPERALAIAVALLVVSCPCALSIATPSVLTAATGSLARAGLLVIRGHALETLARVTHVVFDKTGTLTEGKMRVNTVVAMAGYDRSECIAIARALQHGSEHPISRAVLTLSEAAPWRAQFQAVNLTYVPGSGVEGIVEGVRHRMGRPDFVARLCGMPLPLPDSHRVHQWETSVWLASSHGYLARFDCEDQVRPDAMNALTQLRNAGKRIMILSGDGASPVRDLALRLGIKDCEANLNPQQKLDRVQQLQREGATVMMVGDGVNDAPVLAAADVSVAMAGGSDLARVSADMVLMSPRLTTLAQAVHRATKTLAVVRQNLWWAFAYNLVAIPTTAFGYLTPWMAALGMSLSSLLVTLNALRMLPAPERAEAPASSRRGLEPSAVKARWTSSIS